MTSFYFSEVNEHNLTVFLYLFIFVKLRILVTKTCLGWLISTHLVCMYCLVTMMQFMLFVCVPLFLDFFCLDDQPADDAPVPDREPAERPPSASSFFSFFFSPSLSSEPGYHDNMSTIYLSLHRCPRPRLTLKPRPA